MRAPKYSGVYPRVKLVLDLADINPQGAGVKVVTQDMINAALARYPKCKCSDLGLAPGLSLYQVNRLGEGCHPLWVCPALDKVRRQMGH